MEEMRICERRLDRIGSTDVGVSMHFRFIADLSDLRQPLRLMVMGNSGQAVSPHVDDQLVNPSCCTILPHSIAACSYSAPTKGLAGAVDGL